MLYFQELKNYRILSQYILSKSALIKGVGWTENIILEFLYS